MKEDDYRAEFVGLGNKEALGDFQRALFNRVGGESHQILGTEEGTDGEDIRTSLLVAKQRREMGCE